MKKTILEEKSSFLIIIHGRYIVYYISKILQFHRQSVNNQNLQSFTINAKNE